MNAFADAVHAVRADNAVIAGGMAPFRNDAGDALVIAPLAFMRALLCVSGGRHPKATCATQVKFDIWSHHPYTSGSPTHVAANPDDASISALPEMRRMLSAASRAGHIASSGPVRFWVTEFAWDSNPPDPNGVPERLRSRWIAEALYRMWHAGVSMVTWYKLRDDETSGRPHSATFECGLYYRCGTLACDRPKPSLQAFRFPFVAFRSGRRVYVWGRTPTSKPARVIVQQRVGRRWKRLARLRANRYGIFSRRIRTSRRGKLRARMARAARGRSPSPSGARRTCRSTRSASHVGPAPAEVREDGQVTSSPAERVDVSVLVPVLNEEACIRETVAAMQAQRFDGTIEFLFMDGRSEDGTRSILEQLAAADPRIRVIDNPARSTPSALNAGLRHARGDYVARMDAHAFYPPDLRRGRRRAPATGRRRVGQRPGDSRGQAAAGRGVCRWRWAPGSGSAARGSGAAARRSRSTRASSRAYGSARRWSDTEDGTRAGRPTRTRSWPRA